VDLQRRLLGNFKFNQFFAYSAVSIAVVTLFSISWNRPAQDDYVFLQNLHLESYAHILNNYWSTWGGNLVLAILANFFLKITILTNYTLGYIVFGICSISIMMMAFGSFERLFAPNRSPSSLRKRFLSILLGFHSIGMPVYWGATGFVTAAIAHLWSVCFFVVFFERVYQAKKRSIFYVIPGFLISNLNLGEGLAFSIFLTFYLVGSHLKMKNFSRGYGSYVTDMAFSIGVWLGFIVNIFSPGSQVRAGVLGSTTKSLSSLATGVAIGGLDFLAAILFTVPVFAFILLVVFAKMQDLKLPLFPIMRNFLIQNSLLVLLLIALYCSLTLGSAFSYAAWHQSLGLVFLVFAFSCIAISKLYENGFFPKAPIVFLFIVVSMMSLFDSYSGISRGSSWDQNLQSNYCRLLINQNDRLAGAEIRNPISKLGLEDVNRWDWMAGPYKDLLREKFDGEDVCHVSHTSTP